MIIRKQTKEVKVRDIVLGGGNPIIIQSMTNTKNTKDTIRQIEELTDAGCEIVRIAVPNMEVAESIKQIKENTSIPLVADIHFDHNLALAAMDNGIDALRINPGNIGKREYVEKVVHMAKERIVPIRIGVNAGSLEKDMLKKYNGITADALVESAMGHVYILESLDFDQIVISIKASDVPLTIQSYEKLSSITDYPLHLGITETGTTYAGSIKSAVGIGTILAMGIGDTIRVSLTGDPVEEIKCAKEILKSLNLRDFGSQLISCPTCGRTEIDLIGIATQVESIIANLNKSLKVAVMGCVVNGPGEAREADIGIAGGKGEGIIFKKGKVIKKVHESELVNELVKELESM